jgi:chaperone modulatory protein CbpM
MQIREFLTRTRLDADALDAWIKAGWLRPSGTKHIDFSEIDMARAQLIHDLRHDFGVNDEAVPLILDLIDQVHGLRRLLRDVMEKERA